MHYICSFDNVYISYNKESSIFIIFSFTFSYDYLQNGHFVV